MAKRALHQPCSRGQPGTEIPTKPTDLSTGADTWLGGGAHRTFCTGGKKYQLGSHFTKLNHSWLQDTLARRWDPVGNSSTVSLHLHSFIQFWLQHKKGPAGHAHPRPVFPTWKGSPAESALWGQGFFPTRLQSLLQITHVWTISLCELPNPAPVPGAETFFLGTPRWHWRSDADRNLGLVVILGV